MTFWGLSLYDIHVPDERYQAEIAKQKELLKQFSTDSGRGDPVATAVVSICFEKWEDTIAYSVYGNPRKRKRRES